MSDLERKEFDPGFERRERRIRVAGWVVGALLLAGAVVGVFGDGGVARADAEATVDGARIELTHLRFNRYQHSEPFVVRVTAPATVGNLTVSLSPSIAEAITVRSVSPEASSTTIGAAGGAYTFEVRDWSQPVVAAFDYRPEEAGWTEGVVTVSAGNATHAFPWRQWVWP